MSIGIATFRTTLDNAIYDEPHESKIYNYIPVQINPIEAYT